MITKDRDQTCLRTDRGYLDIRPIIAHDCLDLFEPFRKQPIELSRQNGGISRDDKLALQASAQFHVRILPFVPQHLGAYP